MTFSDDKLCRKETLSQVEIFKSTIIGTVLSAWNSDLVYDAPIKEFHVEWYSDTKRKGQWAWEKQKDPSTGANQFIFTEASL